MRLSLATGRFGKTGCKFSVPGCSKAKLGVVGVGISGCGTFVVRLSLAIALWLNCGKLALVIILFILYSRKTT